MGSITSINIKPANISKSEAHNERRVKLDYIIPDLHGQHEHWKGGIISERLKEIKELYQQQVGQTMQKKAEPIREGVIVIKPETDINDLQLLAKSFKDRFGIECFQIHIHRDEGHVVTEKEVAIAKAMGDTSVEAGAIVINHHAHMIFDWQDKRTGRSIKLNKDDMRDMQSMTADVLRMERGQANSKATRLEAKEFKIFKQRVQDNSNQLLEGIEMDKIKATQEVRLLIDQKKNLMPGLKVLENSYDQIMKELKNSKEELTLLESKFWLLNKLSDLTWNECGSDVQRWLRLVNGLEKVEMKIGKDGSVYFQLEEIKARLKDMPHESQTIIQSKLKLTKKRNSTLRMR